MKRYDPDFECSMTECTAGEWVRLEDLSPASTCSALADHWRDRAERLYNTARATSEATPLYVVERLRARALALHNCADELEDSQNEERTPTP